MVPPCDDFQSIMHRQITHGLLKGVHVAQGVSGSCKKERWDLNVLEMGASWGVSLAGSVQGITQKNHPFRSNFLFGLEL